MTTHLITVRRAKRRLDIPLKTVRLIRDCLTLALYREGITFPCAADVTLTDDNGIRELNRAHREIDAATDVLSFPALEFRDGRGKISPLDLDPETGRLYLGDIVLSVERARVQAEDYGHGLRRECAFLAVHSLMHLLGYDHEDTEARRRRMRAREEAVLSALGLSREE